MLRASDSDADQDNGQIIDSEIAAGYLIRRVHADGAVNSGSAIGITGTAYGWIDRVSSGGDFAGTVQGGRINQVLVGFDSAGARLAEGNGYSGSDLSGSISAIWGLQFVSVTGQIAQASVQASNGSVISVYAEDGFENSSISAYWQVVRLMVGYLNGQRGQIVNEQADVSGSIQATGLGRIYYTGTMASDMTLPTYYGPIRDDVP